MAIPAIVAAMGSAGGGAAAGGAAAGAAAGAAGGSSMSAMVGSIAMSQAQSAATSKAQGALSKLTDTLQSLSPAGLASGKAFKWWLNQLNEFPAKILEVKDMLVGTFENFVKAFAAPVDAVEQMASAIGRFTSLSNPGGMKMLEFRIENAKATIGNMLQPVLDALTRLAEKMGDTFAKLKPAFAPAIKAIEGIIDVFGDRFQEVARILAPDIKIMSDLFLALSTQMNKLQQPLMIYIRLIGQLHDRIRGLLGIKGGGWDADAKSDFAVKEPRYAGAEDIFREQAKNALMASMGPGEEKKTTESLLDGVIKAINNLPENIVNKLKEQVLKVQNVAKEVKDAAVGTAETGARWGVFGIGGQIASRW